MREQHRSKNCGAVCGIENAAYGSPGSGCFLPCLWTYYEMSTYVISGLPVSKSPKHGLLYHTKDVADGPPTWEDHYCLCQAVKLSPAWDSFDDLPTSGN